MKKTLLSMLVIALFSVGVTNAGTRYDKYQAIKEGGEYYNQLQKIYKDSDYQYRHNAGVKKCKEPRENYRQCKQRDIMFQGLRKTYPETHPCMQPQPSIDGMVGLGGWELVIEKQNEICEHPTVGMNEKEEQLYLYIHDEGISLERSNKDARCNYSMNGYYNEKSDKCECEDGFEEVNGVCNKIVIQQEIVEEIIKEEVKETEEEIVEEVVNCNDKLTKLICDNMIDECPAVCVEERQVERAKKYLGKSAAVIETLSKSPKLKDSKVLKKILAICNMWKNSKREDDNAYGIYLEYLLK